MSLSHSGSSPGSYITFSLHVSFVSSGLWQRLRFSLFYKTSVFFKGIWEVFLLNVPHFGFVSCFLTIGSGWEKNTRGVRSLSRCISEGMWYCHDLALVMLTLTSWLESPLSDLSITKFLCFLSIESKRQRQNQHSRGGTLNSTFLERVVLANIVWSCPLRKISSPYGLTE